MYLPKKVEWMNKYFIMNGTLIKHGFRLSQSCIVIVITRLSQPVGSHFTETKPRIMNFSFVTEVPTRARLLWRSREQEDMTNLRAPTILRADPLSLPWELRWRTGGDGDGAPLRTARRRTSPPRAPRAGDPPRPAGSLAEEIPSQSNHQWSASPPKETMSRSVWVCGCKSAFIIRADLSVCGL